MPGNFDFSVLISQVPRVQKIQGDVQQAPVTTQDSLQREVEKKQRQASKEVQQSSEGSQSDKVSINKDGRGGGREKKRKKRERKDPKEDKKSKSPERGKFVDIEV